MPRVVPDQRNKYDTDDVFKKLSQDVDVSGGFAAPARTRAGARTHTRTCTRIHTRTCTRIHTWEVCELCCVCIYTCLRLP